MIDSFQNWLIPELRNARGRAARRELARKAWRRSWNGWKFVLILMSSMVLMILFFASLRSHSISAGVIVYIVVLFQIIAPCFALICIRPSLRRAMRIELCLDGVLLCVKCGYDLSGVDDVICPECGRPTDLFRWT